MLPEALNLLRTQSLRTVVQEKLERMILEGRLAPGDALREDALSISLGVSRGPVREAFRALEEKGLVEVKKNHGVSVRTLSVSEADEIYEVRISLEELIGRKVTSSIKNDDIAQLNEIIARMEEASTWDDVNPYTSLNLAFHDALAQMTGNAKLHETYNRLVGQLSLFRRKAYLHDKQSMSTSLSEHKAILAAVSRHDADLAAQLLADHAADSRSRLHQAIQRN